MGRYNRGRKDHAIDPTSRYCSRQHNLSQTLILQNTFPSSFSVSMNLIDIRMRLTYIWAGWWTPILREQCSENLKLPLWFELENPWILGSWITDCLFSIQSYFKPSCKVLLIFYFPTAFAKQLRLKSQYIILLGNYTPNSNHQRHNSAHLLYIVKTKIRPTA